MPNEHIWRYDTAMGVIFDEREVVLFVVQSHAAAKQVMRVGDLVALLREARRAHHKSYLDESNDYDPCPLSDDIFNDDAKCTCGATEWNARIDKALEGL